MHIVRYHLIKSSKTQTGPRLHKTHIVFDEFVSLKVIKNSGHTYYFTRDQYQMLCVRDRYLVRPVKVDGSVPTCPKCLERMKLANLQQNEDK